LANDLIRSQIDSNTSDSKFVSASSLGHENSVQHYSITKKSHQHWICLPQHANYFLSKLQENNQHLSANNLITPEPLRSLSKLQEALECSADLYQKPASSPSNLRERNLCRYLMKGISQTKDPSPAIPLESSCKPFWNMQTADKYLEALEYRKTADLPDQQPSSIRASQFTRPLEAEAAFQRYFAA